MDRNIVYPGAIPLDSDLLGMGRGAMVALGALIQATLGNTPVVDGLTVAPTTPASLSVSVGPGSITQLTTVDQTAYGSLAADTVSPLMKMGINLAATTLALTAPTTSGQSTAWLIEASFQEADTNATVLPYYNAANPAQPFLGAGNNGAAQPTLRRQTVQIAARAGAPATTGTQQAPPVDSGWVGLAVVTVAYGQTQITAASIAPMATAPVLAYKLPALRPGFSAIQTFTTTGTFTVPAGVNRLKVMVIGGGGGGSPGLGAGARGAGGGGGGKATKIIAVTPGTTYPVVVGAGGAAGVGSDGAGGGTSAFGALCLATGGGGGNYTLSSGGFSGSGSGGDLNEGLGDGDDGNTGAIYGGGRGGGPGGRGATNTGQNGRGPGGGGGGSVGGYTAGAGAPGVVVIEY